MSLSISKNPNVKGPYVVWLDYGYEGWKPTSYNTLKETLQHQTYGSDFVITKLAEFEIIEK